MANFFNVFALVWLTRPLAEAVPYVSRVFHIKTITHYDVLYINNIYTHSSPSRSSSASGRTQRHAPRRTRAASAVASN
jgi:hypothetical protein